MDEEAYRISRMFEIIITSKKQICKPKKTKLQNIHDNIRRCMHVLFYFVHNSFDCSRPPLSLESFSNKCKRFYFSCLLSLFVFHHLANLKSFTRRLKNSQLSVFMCLAPYFCSISCPLRFSSILLKLCKLYRFFLT